MRLSTILVCALVAVVPSAWGQKWEFGGGVGGGFYASNDVTSAGATASAKIQTNLAGSAWVGSNGHGRLGGELRYDYQNGPLQLSQGSNQTTFSGVSHAIHYDFLFHFTDGESRIRPFVSAGAGIKVYRGTGTEVAFQPLSNFALLTKDQDLTGLLSVGAGLKFAIAPHVQLRLDVHDYITPFPKQIIAPASNAKVSGWMQDFVPMGGLAFTY
ncbi:MAG TPA: outer membrane beta-barrel protein [Bryobacteraceae bacterium]